jgi:hypothetical protein
LADSPSALAISNFEEKLAPHLPEGTATVIAAWIVKLNVRFVISKPRQTKLGDFRPGHNGKAPRISVNGDLHPYSFLITTIHEFAHLGCYLKYHNKVPAHGKEWKKLYVDMLKPFVDRNIFPEDLTKALYKHMSKPKASSTSCSSLNAALEKYEDKPGELLANLKPNDHFEFRGEIYRYVLLRRTRILCERISDKRHYLISSRARVIPLVTV